MGYLKGFPESEWGHLDQIRQGLQSTKPITPTFPIVLLADIVDSNMDASPQKTNNNHMHHIFMSTSDITDTISSNQTGYFPITSIQCNTYVVRF
jgi:hypothetical protein